MAKGKDKQKSSDKKKPLKTLLEKRKDKKRQERWERQITCRPPNANRVKLYNA